MRRALMLAAALLAASPVSALSCMEVSPFDTFQARQASPDRYVMLVGRLAFDPARLEAILAPPAEPPPPDGVAPVDLRPARPFVAPFEGEVLTRRGPAPSPIASLTVRPTCGDTTFPCPPFEPGTRRLLFARAIPGGWEVEVAPCGGGIKDPSPAVLRGLRACLRGACPAP